MYFARPRNISILVRYVPVMTFDAPLFALAKFIQWKWPDTHGEDKFVAMLGGLHIGMALWKMYDDYLYGSGWTNALVQTGIASSGTADSFFKVSHLTRTRHTHQVTALALAKLQEDAFERTEGEHSDTDKETKNDIGEPNISVLGYNT